MTSEYLQNLRIARQHLADCGVQFSAGLSNGEVYEIEQRFGFRFPEDLQLFLQTAVPVGDRFPDWRGPEKKIWDFLQQPEAGICFDISHNVFWWTNRGIRPQSDQAAIEITQSKLRVLPPMIPICGHSYLPSEPHAPENPVFSIHQADVIHRGRNLAEYLLWVRHYDNDDDIEERYPVFGEDYRHIPFWSELAKVNASG